MCTGRDLRGRTIPRQAPEKQSGKKPDKASLISGSIVLLIGLYQLISVAILTILRSRMDVVAFISSIVFCVSGYRIITGKEKPKKKKENPQESKSAPRKSRQPAEEEQWKKYIPKAVEPKNSGFSFRADHHQHIQPTGISAEKRLAQLDTLMGAGLYTREEYKKEKDRILSGK